jgi:gibberellin A4 carboxyl methyltransferase
MPTVSGMKPDGFYDQHSSGQRSSIEILLPWIDAAAQAASLPDEHLPITIVDYGCSEGRNSVRVIGRAVEVLRRRGAGHAICPVFSDLASNNFNQVFHNLAESGQLAADHAGFFPLVAGGSFYGPLLAPRSVHLGMTFNAVCWLDSVPSTPIPDFIIYPGPKPHRPDVQVTSEAVAAFTAQAQHDMARFLRCRAEELARGARLLIAVPGRDEKHWTGGGIYDVIHDACMDLVRAGRIDLAAYQRTLMPVYFRTLDELLQPLQSPGSPLAGAFAIEKSECSYVPTSFVVAYQQTGDLQRYVDEYVGFVQAFTEPIIRPALQSVHGPEVIAEIYQRAKERLRAAPEDYVFRYIQVAALLVRR